MADDQTKQRTGALTTPRRQTDPIGTAKAAAATIEIDLQKASKSPFVQHPLTRDVVIGARCIFDPDQGGPIEKRTNFTTSGQPAKIVFSLSKKQADALAAVEVWAEPYGYAAVLDAKNGQLALGRLHYDKPLAGAQNNHAVCEVHVLDSVVAFIVGEMSRNAHSPDMQATRRANDAAAKSFADAAELRKEAPNAGFFSSGGMYQAASDLDQAGAAQKTIADGIFAYHVHTKAGVQGWLPGGDWDHKPRIGPVWGQKNRLGDSAKVYYYDIWSNIHFGYVGRAAGFSLDELLGGSNAQQNVYSPGQGDEDADKDTIRAGFALYSDAPGATVTIPAVLAVVAAHDDWLYDARQAAWDKMKGKK
jgi:hypothetical protein